MKSVSKSEWEQLSMDFKRMYDVTPYMVYKETDGSTCFGPVRIVEKNDDDDSSSCTSH